MKIKIIFTGVIFLVLSIFIIFFSLNYTKNIEKFDFENQISKVKQSFSGTIESTEAIVNSYQVLFTSLGKIEKKAFQNYSENIMNQFPYVKSVAVHSKVSEWQRKHFEKQFQNEIIDEIIEDGKSKLVPAKSSNLYYPLLYIDKINEQGSAFGWNALSDPTRKKAIESCIKKDKPFASSSYLLSNGDAAFDIYFPIKILGAANHLISLTIDLPLLLGNTNWFENVDVILSVLLNGKGEKKDIFKHNDQEKDGNFQVGAMNSQISSTNFGQEIILKFEKILYLNKIKYGILILVAIACLITMVLSCYLVYAYELVKLKNDSLKEINENLEEKVKDRTKELNQTNEEINEILNNLHDAVMIINSDYIIQNRYSPATVSLLNLENPQGMNVKDVLFSKLDKTNEKVSRHYFTLGAIMDANLFQWEICHDDLLKTIPYYIENKENSITIKKTLSLKYTPFFENDELKRMLIVASDLTEIIQLRENFEQQQKASQQKNIAINEIISADKSLIDEFFEDSKKFMISPLSICGKVESDLKILNQIFRDLHTLKGNSRALKFAQLGKVVHEVENEFVLFKENPVKSLTTMEKYNKQIEKLKELFSIYLEIYEQVFKNEKNQGVSKEIIEKSAKWLLKDGQESKIVALFLHDISNNEIFSFNSFCESFINMINEISQKLEKEVQLVIMANDLYFTNTITFALRSAFTHILRNSLDHGIENPVQRKNKNKNVTGKIWFESKILKHQGVLQLLIHDDGQGVQFHRVYSIAKEKGLVNKEFSQFTNDEIVEFLFLPGFSTKEEVSDISGRGVGLDAIRSELANAHISVKMHSEIDMGSYFVLNIPLSTVRFLEDSHLFLTCV